MHYNNRFHTYRIYILSNKNPQTFEKVKYLQDQLKLLIESNKERYYLRISRKLMDPVTSAKTYWSVLKSLSNNKKVPCIPPLFHQNKYVNDFKKKTELFNCFFAKQCQQVTLMVLIFADTNFHGFRKKSRQFVPAKCLDLSKPQKLIPAKFFFRKSDFSQFTIPVTNRSL